jgi:hypothetical protein
VPSRPAVDEWAANLLADDLRAVLRGAEPPVPGWQPLDQAVAESTPDSRYQQADALAHLRTVLLTAPPDRATAGPHGWRLGVLRSCVVDPAARAMATRCRTTAAPTARPGGTAATTPPLPSPGLTRHLTVADDGEACGDDLDTAGEYR